MVRPGRQEGTHPSAARVSSLGLRVEVGLGDASTIAATTLSLLRATWGRCQPCGGRDGRLSRHKSAAMRFMALNNSHDCRLQRTLTWPHHPVPMMAIFAASDVSLMPRRSTLQTGLVVVGHAGGYLGSKRRFFWQ